MSFFTSLFSSDKPAVGLDISNTSLRYVILKRSGKNREIVNYGQVPIPEGVLKHGRVANEKGFKLVLRELREKHGVKKARVSLPESNIYRFSVSLVNGKPEQLRAQVGDILDEHVPFSGSEAFFELDVIETVESAEAQKVLVSVTVFNRTSLEQFIELIKSEKIDPYTLELEADALSRVVVPSRAIGQHVIIDIGAHKTGVMLSENQRVIQAGVVKVGGEDVTNRITSEIGVDKQQAVKLKHSNQFSVSEMSDFTRAVQPTARSFFDDISRLLFTWGVNTLPEETRLNMWILGGGAKLKGLPEYLSDKFKVSIQTPDVWVNADLRADALPSLSYAESAQYAVAIGLALGE